MAPKKGEYVRVWTGELGVCLGKWIHRGRWDGSYRVRHEDGTEGYWFPKGMTPLGVMAD